MERDGGNNVEDDDGDNAKGGVEDFGSPQSEDPSRGREDFSPVFEEIRTQGRYFFRLIDLWLNFTPCIVKWLQVQLELEVSGVFKC